MGYIQNQAELTSHGLKELRTAAIDIIEHSLQASDPYIAVKRMLTVHGDVLEIGSLKLDLKKFERIIVIGAGKATGPIAQALEEILGDRIFKGIVVLKHGYPAKLKHIETIFGAHPVPDINGHMGAQKIFELASTCTEKDLVIAAITGGSSALLPFPVDGVSLEDKKKVNELLLMCGADITQINAVRKHLSRIKGGWLANQILPATLLNLTVSDVIGDPLDYITCPTVPDTSTFDDACKVLDDFDLWDEFPRSASNYLKNGHQGLETPKTFPGDKLHTFIVVNSAVACEEALRRSQQLGFSPILLTTMLKGEARDAGTFFGAIAREIHQYQRPIPPPCAIIAGGENTVTILEKPGEGGPNQEFALSSAREIHGLANVVLASLDTDGTDGPTNVAGGLVDCHSFQRAKSLGFDLDHALKTHHTKVVLEKLGDAIVTGHTGTNINDLKILLVNE